jgi:hypothetical protein
MDRQAGFESAPHSHDDASRADELRSAAARLETAVSRASTDERRWALRLKRAVGEAFSVLDSHRQQNEGKDGLLGGICEMKPGLLPEAAQRENEHATMLHQSAELETLIERQIAFDDIQPELLRLEVRVLSERMRLHLLRTDSLVTEAYLRDEGGEG